MIVTENIVCEGEELVLSNQRALYWQRKKMLILSDLHIGKTAHFRKNGIAIPKAVMQNDLQKLSVLINFFEAQQLLVVGDLFHAGENSDLLCFENWRENHKTLEMGLVLGNHDTLALDYLQKLSITVYEGKFYQSPFVFCHDACDEEQRFSISGHIHPGILIEGNGRQSVRLPCYLLNENGIVLPAFSEFTGLETITARRSRKVYAFTKKEFFCFE